MLYYRTPTGLIERHKNKLADAHYEVLMMYASLVGTGIWTEPKIVYSSVYQEMANRLNVALGTVKSRLNRARKALQKLVDAGRAPSEA